ncbi:thiol-disulfide oxidoreductase DCC family protein [Cohnella sp. JJ-181]|uniref:thiol-disulfide oxidoreductase DCC family protein n=1 Tax=Cohnella rhizoplanae TaxID=2974897 RepID=UPI0022FF5C4E|nr:DCC1-like thiol-disulfide oxidoreductase family protein [Cohnella sp. JJ-181]CAI6078520.1 hypothetical protein COHCIP112018_02661 [Cohnella sp. JJ-181]
MGGMERKGRVGRMGPQKDNDKLVLLVDGECAMCRGIARFAAKRDRAERLRFAALDSAAGAAVMGRLGLAPPEGSFVLVRGEAAWTRSDAALRALSALDAPWPAIAAALRLVPRRLRDAVYEAIAARRRRFAARGAAQCPARPDARLRRRLLDADGWRGAVEGDASAAIANASPRAVVDAGAGDRCIAAADAGEEGRA